MNRRPIACIVLNWNGDALNCVRSLLASENVNANILVIDNGSTDGSDKIIEDSFPTATILRNSQNIGVASSWNVGVRWAMEQNADLLFFLNDDARVNQDCLASLVQTIERVPGVGIVSPRIIDGTNSGKIWFDGGVVNVFGDTVHRGFAKTPDQAMGEFSEEFSTGCAMLVRTEVFKRIGFFDESFFAYSEDADFSFRVRKGGFTIMHNPRALVVHHPSTATRKNRGKWFRDYYVTRNKLLLVRKHLQGMRWSVFLLYFGFKYIAIPILYFTLTGQFKRIAAVVRGIRDFITGSPGKRYS